MKKLILIIIFFGIATSYMFAQADAHFSLFEYSQNIVNPGAAGANDAFCFTTSHRQQWVGYGGGEGRPISTLFSFDMPLNAIKSGLGIAVLQDKLGFQSDIQLKLNYAYRLKVGDVGILGIGLGLGMVNRSINPEWETSASFNNGQVYDDPALPHMENITVFDMNFGITLYGKDFWAGLSSTHLTGPKMTYNVEAVSRLVQHIYLMGGYTLHLPNPSFDIIASGMLQTDRFSKAEFQINAKFMYEKKFWAGISGRLDAIVPMVGVHLPLGPGAISFAYCYDIKLNKIGASGSHELMARYCFNLERNNTPTREKTVRRL
ncbi:MAG: type IX secretion system membrane protein PorP/SprF [Bacteroidales bacterium]|jgi:type IX secretion system PorP/SprF family membrane protein|nr:type IX secretion system membrane protein PorP/SprF [Bacteroidales bacterium]